MHALNAQSFKLGAHVGKAGVADGKARVACECGGGVNRLRVFVESDQATTWRQARKHRARVAATAEGAVDVDALGRGHQRIHRLS